MRSVPSSSDGKRVFLPTWLATSWSYNADKTVLTMKLRTDVKFTDGTPFDASVAAQNLIRFRDGTSANKSYLVMELIPGHTLRDVIRNESPMPPIQALALMEPIVSALAARGNGAIDLLRRLDEMHARKRCG